MSLTTLIRRLLWLVPLVLATLGVLGIRRAKQDAAARASVNAQPLVESDLPIAHAAAAPVRTEAPGAAVPEQPVHAGSALPASLQGTAIDGELHVDATGVFVPDASAVRFFEYFLSALGELDEEALRARLLQEMGTRLSASALPAATRFLDDYLRYRREAGDLGRVTANPDDLHAAVDRLYALRRDVFGSALADRLFADDEARRTAALERRLILADSSLSEQERAQRLVALDRDLPADVQLARAQSFLPLATRNEIEALRAQGASEAEVRAARTKALGAEAADRLEALDRKRADFAHRLADFRTRRAALERATGSPAEERGQAIQALFEETFEPTERVRAELLTR